MFRMVSGRGFKTLRMFRLNGSGTSSFVLKNCFEIKQVEKFASDIAVISVRSTGKNPGG